MMQYLHFEDEHILKGQITYFKIHNKTLTIIACLVEITILITHTEEHKQTTKYIS